MSALITTERRRGSFLTPFVKIGRLAALQGRHSFCLTEPSRQCALTERSFKLTDD